MMFNEFVNSKMNLALSCRDILRRRLLSTNISKFRELALLTILTLFPVPANSENLCIKGLIQKRELSGKIQFYLKDFDSVVFETEKDCNVVQSCSYKIILSSFESSQVIRSNIVYSDFCNLIVRSEENFKNSDYENSPTSFGTFEEIKLISYRVENSYGFLNLGIYNYHHGRKEIDWGLWEGDSGGGGILSPKITTYEILTGWIK